jgi:hypothetical protein
LGGTSDQVQTITTTLQSRSHNELVVDKLQFYINYLVQEYNLIDGYGSVPFHVTIDKSDKYQALLGLNLLMKTYEITIPFQSQSASLIRMLIIHTVLQQ